jgi:arylformamidase
VQDWLALTKAEVETLSPLRHSKGTAKTLVAVAEHETPGFHRQSKGYAEALGAPLLSIPARNHFDVILDLMQPDTALSQGLLGLFKP